MDNHDAIYLLIIFAIVTLIADFITYYLESKQKKKRQRILSKMKRLNMIREPIDSKLINLTFAEFVYYEKYEKSSVASLAYSLGDGHDDEIDHFGFKLDYYWFCKEDLRSYQREIIGLWSEYFHLFNNNSCEVDQLRKYLNQLSSLTYNSGLEQGKKEKIDTEFLRILEDYYARLLRENDFYIAITKILEWYYYRTDYYYDIMGIGTTESELYVLEQIYNNYEKELEKLKNDSPPTFLSYTGVVYHFYKNLPKITDRNYDHFYRYFMLSRIAVLRNIGEYEKMSDSIYMFYKGQKKKLKSWKLFWDHILDYGTGYGEKPTRLLFIFLFLYVLFFFVFYPYPNSPIKLTGIDLENNNIFENAIDVIYFNSTTMLSNLYGNVSPANWQARLIVIVQQVAGFIITGSFIALFLRKLFRH
ncbi:ion channel [Bacillus sp. DJP31]|uniref:ion channel n=1 Tax=Bacillus sp. DJP31 TaxID=3409789 RepID=UPI003BB761F2